MNNNIYLHVQDGRLGAVRDTDTDRLRKSAADAGQRLVRTTAVRMVMKGRDEMDPNQRFINGGIYLGMLPEVIEVVGTAEAVREIKERLLKSANPAAAQEWDAGRCRESDIVNALGGEDFVKSGGVDFDPAEDADRDADGNLIETFHKGGDGPTMFGGGSLLTKAYREAAQHGDISLREAAEELDRLSDKFLEGR